MTGKRRHCLTAGYWQSAVSHLWGIDKLCTVKPLLQITFCHTAIEREPLISQLCLPSPSSWFKECLMNQEKQPIRGITVVLLYQTATNRLAHLLSHKNIRTSDPLTKIRQNLHSVKDLLGVCRVTCDCGASYVKQTSRLVSVRLTEHRRHMRLRQVDKSAIAQHCSWHWSPGAQSSSLVCRNWSAVQVKKLAPEND